MIKSKKVFIELAEGEIFQVDEPPPVGEWKEINDMSPNDWLKLVMSLRQKWDSACVEKSFEIQELKKELYILREGVNSSQTRNDNADNKGI